MRIKKTVYNKIRSLIRNNPIYFKEHGNIDKYDSERIADKIIDCFMSGKTFYFNRTPSNYVSDELDYLLERVYTKN